MLVGSAFRFTFGTLTIGGRVILIACSIAATIDNLLTTFQENKFFVLSNQSAHPGPQRLPPVTTYAYQPCSRPRHLSGDGMPRHQHVALRVQRVGLMMTDV